MAGGAWCQGEKRAGVAAHAFRRPSTEASSGVVAVDVAQESSGFDDAAGLQVWGATEEGAV